MARAHAGREAARSPVCAHWKDADPGVVDEWEWRCVPMWFHDGIVCTGETYASLVKTTLAKGAGRSRRAHQREPRRQHATGDRPPRARRARRGGFEGPRSLGGRPRPRSSSTLTSLRATERYRGPARSGPVRSQRPPSRSRRSWSRPSSRAAQSSRTIQTTAPSRPSTAEMMSASRTLPSIPPGRPGNRSALCETSPASRRRPGPIGRGSCRRPPRVVRPPREGRRAVRCALRW
jgi:hypothetical protein